MAVRFTLAAIALAATTGVAAAASVAAHQPGSPGPGQPTPEPPAAMAPAPVNGAEMVHLGQVLSEKAPIFPGDPRVEIQPWSTFEEDGYRLERITIGTHTGTHVSAPCHFLAGTACLDDLPAAMFVRPAVVIDVRARIAAAKDQADFQLTWADIRAWERRHGRIPGGALVLLHTGFGRLFSEPARPGPANDYFDPAPGFSAEAVRALVEERRIAGLGSDTFGPDATSDSDYSASTAIYTAGGITIENMTNLDQLPPNGSTVVATPARLREGSGFQTNPIGIVPRPDRD